MNSIGAVEEHGIEVLGQKVELDQIKFVLQCLLTKN